MTVLLDQFPATSSYENTSQQRLDLIDDIEKAQNQPNSVIRKMRAAYLSRKALRLAQRKQVYLVEGEDLLHRAVALNPNIEEKAHQTLDRIYEEEHPELAEAGFEGLPAAKEVAHLALERTVEITLDLMDHDDTPTIPIPIAEIVGTAVSEVSAEQTQQLPKSKNVTALGKAWKHLGKYRQEQKVERLESATPEKISEVDNDTEKLTPEQMKALLFDDDDDIARVA